MYIFNIFRTYEATMGDIKDKVFVITVSPRMSISAVKGDFQNLFQTSILYRCHKVVVVCNASDNVTVTPGPSRCATPAASATPAAVARTWARGSSPGP